MIFTQSGELCQVSIVQPVNVEPNHVGCGQSTWGLEMLTISLLALDPSHLPCVRASPFMQCIEMAPLRACWGEQRTDQVPHTYLPPQPATCQLLHCHGLLWLVLLGRKREGEVAYFLVQHCSCWRSQWGCWRRRRWLPWPCSLSRRLLSFTVACHFYRFCS